MQLNRTVAALAALALAAIVATPAGAQDFRWTGKLAQGKTLEVRGVNGDVDVTLASGSDIEVTAVKRGRDDDPAEVKVEVVEHGEGVTICAVYPDRRGEIYGLVHNPSQLWFYVPDMGLDEAVLIKCYDSRRDVARFTPHTAFQNPLTPPAAPPRESIEFRTIALF